MLRRRHLSLPPLAPPPRKRGPRGVPQARKNSQTLKFLIKNDMRLSKNFTLEEMMATSHGKLQDMPTGEVILNLTFLCARVLQPLRDAIGRPVYINSGYRSKRLNARVGGVPNSYHLRGLAADIHVDNDEHAKVLFDILRQNKWVDMLIMERKGSSRWLHVQTRTDGRQRRRAVW